MRILVDMNLSPEWIRVLEGHGHVAVHWSGLGDPAAPDAELLDWARRHDHVVLTHDLDLGTLLTLTRAGSPSVLQVRLESARPTELGDAVAEVLAIHEAALLTGAIVTLNPRSTRVRHLPVILG